LTAIEHFVGPVVFEVKRGSATFRKVTIRNLAAIFAFRPGDPALKSELESPGLVKEVRPNYTRSAMERKIQGVVGMDVIVLDDGRVGPVWITKPLDPDLEQMAVVAVTQWRFQPGKRRGNPVAMYAAVELTFTLR
jgi:TonB family protein